MLTTQIYHPAKFHRPASTDAGDIRYTKFADRQRNIQQMIYPQHAYRHVGIKINHLATHFKSHCQPELYNSVLSINQFIRHNQTHEYKIIIATHRKLLYGMTVQYPRSSCSACTGYPCNENKQYTHNSTEHKNPRKNPPKEKERKEIGYIIIKQS